MTFAYYFLCPEFATYRLLNAYAGRFQPPYTWAGKNAFLGLATPGEPGSWQTESKVRQS